MGKQSRRRKDPSSSSRNIDGHIPSDSAAVAEALSNTTISSEASCWICLDEGPDDSGQPLVRDCSCRGDSGYYHLSCIIKYAEKKSEDWDGLESKGLPYEIGDYSKPWHQCPNCNQSYQNKLLLDLADGLISFTNKFYPCHPAIQRFGFPCDPVMLLEALDTKTNAYRQMTSRSSNVADEVHYREETKSIASKIISLVEKVKTQIYNGSSVPYSVSANGYKSYNTLGICLVEEAQLSSRSNMYKESSTFKLGIKHLEMSRDLARSNGDAIFAKGVETLITQAKAFAGDSGKMTKHTIEHLREEYNRDPCANGMPLFMALQSKLCIIECERLLEEMIARSRRINGPNHDETREFVSHLDRIKSRKGTVLAPGNDCLYNIIRYVDDKMDKCVLNGPWAKLNCPPEEARNLEVKTIVVESDKVLLSKGTPVVCQGLKNASHLNGKIGDIRDYGKGKLEDIGEYRYCVYFEDESIKPCLVKHKNVRILFDLP